MINEATIQAQFKQATVKGSVATLQFEILTDNADAFRRTRVARLREGRLKLKVVVDEWIVEVYADDGLYAHALLFFARNGVKKLEWTDGASVSVAALQ